MVGKVLRLVNSSFFGLGSKVSTVSRAVVILGFNTVRNALISISIIDSTKNFHGNKVNMKDFWQHAISCAVVAKYLSSRTHIGLPEEAFTVGIVHDIGKLVLAKYFPDEFLDIMKKATAETSFYDAETGVIPVHHNHIGAYLTERWRLPKNICDAIRFSHNMPSNSQNPLAGIVLCSDAMVNSGCFMAKDEMEKDDQEEAPVILPPGDILDQLKPEVENRHQWIPEILPEIQAATSILLSGASDG
jgi:HD-like signal output (HDOD) protein